MMTPEEVRNITSVFSRFIATESNPKWDDFDDQMSHLEYLEDHELILEVQIMLAAHSTGVAGCGEKHSNCHVPKVIEAVESIVELQKTAKDLHPNNRYILQFYMAISHLGEIVIEQE